MNKVIDEIFSTKEVEKPDGSKLPLRVNLDRAEGEFICELIKREPSITKTLEVGCAYGLSSLFIAEGLKGRPGAMHTMLDPNQHTTWEGVGIHHLKKAGFDSFELVEKKSEFALPGILEENEESFDLVLVDGWHTFDHTLLDCFYATRLLKVGGYLLVDDVSFPAIRRVIDYFLQYPCFEFEAAVAEPKARSTQKKLAGAALGILPSNVKKSAISKSFCNKVESKGENLVALKKVAKDERGWKWYQNDF